MKRKDLAGFKNSDIKSLRKVVFDKKAEASKIKMDVAAGKEKNLKVYGNLRKDVAKLLTLIKEKEILEKLEHKSK